MSESRTKLDSEVWRCQGCGGTFIGGRPTGAEVELCKQCTLTALRAPSFEEEIGELLDAAGTAASPRRFGQEPGQPPPNKGRRYPAEVLAPEEVTALIAGCSATAPTGIRNRALLTLLYRSGLRVSEIVAVRPSDLSLRSHSVRLLDTKSGTAQTRGFHPSADDALARWIDTRQARAIGRRGGALFCTLDGGPISDDYVRGLLRRLAAKAGITKRVHPHGLRHTFAAELERAGTPVTVISKLLGHSSIAVTARYLEHLTNGQAVTVLETTDLPPI